MWGNVIVAMVRRKTVQCNSEEILLSCYYIWLVISHLLIISYFSLLVYGLNASFKAKEVKKQLLQLLRKFNNSELSSDHDIVDNAI